MLWYAKLDEIDVCRLEKVHPVLDDVGNAGGVVDSFVEVIAECAIANVRELS